MHSITLTTNDAAQEEGNENDDGVSIADSDVPDQLQDSPEPDEEPMEIAYDETKRLFWIRVLVACVLMASTVGVACAVYKYTSGAEQKEFKTSRQETAAKILGDVQDVLKLTLGAVDTFCISLLSYAQASNSEWPFVTNPDFAVQASKLRRQAKAFVVSSHQLVSTEQREAWQNYSVANDAWVNQSVELLAQDESYHGIIMENWTINPIISGLDGAIVAPGPYLPTWQSSPTVAVFSPYNYDPYSNHYIRPMITELLTNKTPVLSISANLNYDDLTVKWARGYIGEDENANEPILPIFYPIIKGATGAVKLDTEKLGRDDYPVVGLINISVFWRNFLRDILPGGSGGSVVVIGNACNQSFTYQVNGPDTMYLGRGDLHDPRFDGMETFAKILVRDQEGNTYSGIPFRQQQCSYWIKIFPSKTMKDKFVTNRPIIYTIVATMIFCFTCMVFLVYDHQVERRQRKVLHNANHTSVIVSSLFPAVVRDRLFPLESKCNDVEAKGRLCKYMKAGENFHPNPNCEKHGHSGRPIAEAFQETTIMFADIKGFTSWSSNRNPEHVFHLLECLFGCFDTAASKRGVFKVETIGDTYVAVCGLPDPCKKHAVVMARFANDCRIAMTRLCRDLSATLGNDTADLALRIGLHSGPVTAGVLRGKRSRFQLFGDAVNTASRMESTGIAGKIQASGDTASLLISTGKDHWVKRRGDPVHAKGKGIMQTFWIEPMTASAASAVVEPSAELETPTATSITSQEY